MEIEIEVCRGPSGPAAPPPGSPRFESRGFERFEVEANRPPAEYLMREDGSRRNSAHEICGNPERRRRSECRRGRRGRIIKDTSFFSFKWDTGEKETRGDKVSIRALRGRQGHGIVCNKVIR